LIKIKNLKKKFGDREVLKGINLDIKSEKTTVVLGVSGGGKSTIIKHIIGLLKADSGEIWIDNRDITKIDEKTLMEIRKDVGFLFQNGALFDSMNVEQNVAFPLVEHTNMSRREISKEVNRLLDIVGLNPDIVNRLYPDELSGGMKKRVGLARTLALKPKAILYDEPTSGLDPITSDLISQLIIKLQHELKTTSVLITHDMNEAFKCADYLAMLYEGEIIAYDTNENFKKIENPVIKKFIGL